jgi:hypothetical protein
MGVRDRLDESELLEGNELAAPGSDAPRQEPDPSSSDTPREPDASGSDAPREIALAEGPDGSGDRPQSRLPEETRSRGEARADLRQLADGDWETRPFEAPRAELGRFDPERAGLPSMSLDVAAKYIEQHRTARPWLAKAAEASPEAGRIIAAMDSTHGHGQIRHEGWVTEEASMRRVTYLEDPAQLDPEKRSLGIDGLKQNDKRHRCADIATRITDPDAFATAFARGVEHPKVREALGAAFDPGKRPREVTVPITDLLGPDGYRYCTGWQLNSVDGSDQAAHINRGSWLAARAEGRTQEVTEPQASPVPTFKGGVITFVFAGNEIERRYEIVTMYPDPPATVGTEESDASALLGTSSGRPVRDAHRGRDNLPPPRKL